MFVNVFWDFFKKKTHHLHVSRKRVKKVNQLLQNKLSGIQQNLKFPMAVLPLPQNKN
jgi:hypothetical protein